ncbi:MAG: putative oxidoreductase C-terminal domain-containing protein [Gemmatimonadota bacterium]|nr:putative oxidoreductase C-terminal domain-containing protein [Gemmatimonadota bacterium]
MHLKSAFAPTSAILVLGLFIIILAGGCVQEDMTGKTTAQKPKPELHRFMILDPGHFHAGLVLKRPSYEGVSSLVDIYAPVGEDFVGHMSRVAPFNTRKENPAQWKYQIYLGEDYARKMLEEGAGDIVLLSGRNNEKIDRILASVKAGYNVLSDKPWVIDPAKFPVLEEALALANQKGLIAYDIMTQRYGITSIMQRLIMNHEPVFGKIAKGSPQDPAVVKKSVHHFSKLVAGKPLVRPWWYFDTSIQGEGIVDVNTHLVDITFWLLQPDVAIDYKTDIEMISAEHWPTVVTPKQFTHVTRKPEFPPGFELDKDGNLPCYCNGKMVFSLMGVHVELEVAWNYEAPKGTGDTHYSIIKGTKANLLLLQGKEQNFRPELYLEPAAGTDRQALGKELESFIASVAADKYPGVSVVDEGGRWRIEIPKKHHKGHEAEFGKVTGQFLKYLDGAPMPDWEVPNMLAKYYVTTKALELCRAQR